MGKNYTQTKHLIYLCLFLFIFFETVACGDDFFWRFNVHSDLSKWKVSGVDTLNVDEKGVLMEGYAPTVYIHVVGAGMRLRALRVRLKSQRDGLCVIELMAGSQNHSEKINVTGGWIPHDYVLYAKGLSRGHEIDGLRVRLPADQPVHIESIALERLSLPVLLRIWWKEFWTADIGTDGVNFISSPRIGGITFMALLYVLVAVLILSAYVWLMIKKHERKKEAILRVFLVSLILAGTVFALRMDYNWMKMWQGDIRAFRGLSLEKKIRVVHDRSLDDFFDFIALMRDAVPEGAKIYPAVKDSADYLAVLDKRPETPGLSRPGMNGRPERNQL